MMGLRSGLGAVVGDGILKIVMINQFPDEMELNKWYCAMQWCPSQCYKHVQGEDGTHYILYLRWRWDDPWQGHIIKGAYNESSIHDAEWSHDLLTTDELYFEDRQVEQAKAAIERLWLEASGENQREDA